MKNLNHCRHRCRVQTESEESEEEEEEEGQPAEAGEGEGGGGEGAVGEAGARPRQSSSSGSWGSCVVCLQHRRRVVFSPCGHRACCMSCARQVAQARGLADRRCPVCRREIRREVIRVYDP